MAEVNDAARVQLNATMQGICKANRGSLTEVSLIEFTKNLDEGLALLNVIQSNAKLIRVQALDLSDNTELFANAEFIDAVCLLLTKQTALKHLRLCDNDFSSEATAKIISIIQNA